MKALKAPRQLKIRFVRELLWFTLGGLLVFALAARYDLAEQTLAFMQRHEHLEFDEIIPVVFYGLLAVSVIVVRRWHDAVKAMHSEQRLNQELKQALAEIDKLEGILPVCSFCKRIRDEEGNWQQMERYIRDRSAADFSHGICEDCMKKHYPDHVD